MQSWKAGMVQPVTVYAAYITVFHYNQPSSKTERSGSRESSLTLRPLSGKEAHVAVSSSPKNEPCWFPISSLKPSATNKANSFGAIADGRLYADVSNSLLYLCRHCSLLPCDEFAVLLH